MPIKGIAFDLEGTVINVEAAHHQAHIISATEVGLVMTLDEAYVRLPHLIGGPREKICQEVWELLDPEAKLRVTVEDILERDRFHYNRLVIGMRIEPRPGFLEAFRAIQEMGLAVSIGSLTVEEQAGVLLSESGLGDLFGLSRIVLRHHVKEVKPDPEVFLKTAELMGIDPTEQLVFEDSPRGVKAALAARSKAVGMPVIIRPETIAALVEAGVSRIFYDWREINIPALIENLSNS